MDAAKFLGQFSDLVDGGAYSARNTAGTVGGFGEWGSCLYRGEYFDSRGVWPEGSLGFAYSRVDVTPHGWLQFVLQDRLGWKPFLVIFGVEAGRKIRAGVTFSVNMPDDYPGFAIEMNRDPLRESYEVIGPTSDGSCEQAGRPMSIQIQPQDGAAISIIDAVVGWTQLTAF